MSQSKPLPQDLEVPAGDPLKEAKARWKARALAEAAFVERLLQTAEEGLPGPVVPED